MTLIEAAANFAHGYMSDIPRDQLPADAAYRMKDWIPGLDARLRGRGGWQYTSPDLSTIHAGPTAVSAVGWAPFLNDEHLVIVTNDGSSFLDQKLDGIHATYVATPTNIPISSLIWHQDLKGMVILDHSGTLPPQKYTSSAAWGSVGTYGVSTLGGTPPAAKVGASWGDYLLLAVGTVSSVVYSNRIWVSAPGDAQTWTPGTNFWDSSIPAIVALVALDSSRILVFGYGNTNLISGDTPPAGGNWSESQLFGGIGCFDARSVARYNEFACFANNNGVYMTDGTTLTDLTQSAGVKQRWKELVGTFSYFSGWSAAGGVYRNYYIVSVHDQNGNFVTCHVFDIVHGVAFEFTNIRAAMFAHTTLGEGATFITGEERLFMAPVNGKHVEGLHFAWTAPDAMQDADGTNVLPQLETAYYKLGGTGQKRFRSARATYDVRAQSGSTPSLAVDYALTPGGSYVNAGSLPTTTDEARARVDVRDSGKGIGLRFTQAGLSGHTTLSDLELDMTALEGTR